MDEPIVHPPDHLTTVALQATYLDDALRALRRAVRLEGDDDDRAALTMAAAEVARLTQARSREFSELRRERMELRQAADRLAHAALAG